MPEQWTSKTSPFNDRNRFERLFFNIKAMPLVRRIHLSFNKITLSSSNFENTTSICPLNIINFNALERAHRFLSSANSLPLCFSDHEHHPPSICAISDAVAIRRNGSLYAVGQTRFIGNVDWLGGQSRRRNWKRMPCPLLLPSLPNAKLQ